MSSSPSQPPGWKLVSPTALLAAKAFENSPCALLITQPQCAHLLLCHPPLPWAARRSRRYFKKIHVIGCFCKFVLDTTPLATAGNMLAGPTDPFPAPTLSMAIISPILLPSKQAEISPRAGPKAPRSHYTRREAVKSQNPSCNFKSDLN